MKISRNGLMKKSYIFAVGAAFLMLGSCNTTKRYGCNRRGCIVMQQNTIEPAAAKAADYRNA